MKKYILLTLLLIIGVFGILNSVPEPIQILEIEHGSYKKIFTIQKTERVIELPGGVKFAAGEVSIYFHVHVSDDEIFTLIKKYSKYELNLIDLFRSEINLITQLTFNDDLIDIENLITLLNSESIVKFSGKTYLVQELSSVGQTAFLQQPAFSGSPGGIIYHTKNEIK